MPILKTGQDLFYTYTKDLGQEDDSQQVKYDMVFDNVSPVT